MRWGRLILILLAIAAWIWSVPLIFRLSTDWRWNYDISNFPPDGQTGMDVFAFALLGCLGYILATLVGLLVGHWWWRRRRNGRL